MKRRLKVRFTKQNEEKEMAAEGGLIERHQTVVVDETAGRDEKAQMAEGEMVQMSLRG